MKQRYRISPQGRASEPSDAEIARYRDPERLRHNYNKALNMIHGKPIYKDRKAFFGLLLILLLIWLIVGSDPKRKKEGPPAQATEQEAPR